MHASSIHCCSIQVYSHPSSKLAALLKRDCPILHESYWPTPWAFNSHLATILRSSLQWNAPVQYKRLVYNIIHALSCVYSDLCVVNCNMTTFLFSTHCLPKCEPYHLFHVLLESVTIPLSTDGNGTLLLSF